MRADQHIYAANEATTKKKRARVYCDVCNKSLAGDLARHKRTHGKPHIPCDYAWEGCKLMFNQRSNMQSHVAAKHAHEIRYYCPYTIVDANGAVVGPCTYTASGASAFSAHKNRPSNHGPLYREYLASKAHLPVVPPQIQAVRNGTDSWDTTTAQIPQVQLDRISGDVFCSPLVSSTPSPFYHGGWQTQLGTQEADPGFSWPSAARQGGFVDNMAWSSQGPRVDQWNWPSVVPSAPMMTQNFIDADLNYPTPWHQTFPGTANSTCYALASFDIGSSAQGQVQDSGMLGTYRVHAPNGLLESQPLQGWTFDMSSLDHLPESSTSQHGVEMSVPEDFIHPHDLNLGRRGVGLASTLQPDSSSYPVTEAWS